MKLLPCTKNLTESDINSAQSIILNCMPPGYELEELYPEVTTHPYPHRWCCIYRRIDNTYEITQPALKEMKNEFKMYCPAGCVVGEVAIRTTQDNMAVCVTYIVNCLCISYVCQQCY